MVQNKLYLVPLKHTTEIYGRIVIHYFREMGFNLLRLINIALKQWDFVEHFWPERLLAIEYLCIYCLAHLAAIIFFIYGLDGWYIHFSHLTKHKKVGCLCYINTAAATRVRSTGLAGAKLQINQTISHRTKRGQRRRWSLSEHLCGWKHWVCGRNTFQKCWVLNA